MCCEDTSYSFSVHVAEHLHQLGGESVIPVYSAHRPRGDSVVGLGTVVVGDVDLLLVVVSVLHEECVCEKGVCHRTLRKKSVLGGVHMGMFGHCVVNASGNHRFDQL